MRYVKIDRLEFSPWHKWENRAEIPNSKYPGVYLIAISKDPDLEGKTPRWKDVVYIGCSNNAFNGLQSRWRQFDRTIRGIAVKGHSGARTIRKAKGTVDTWREHLYVAAKAVKCDPKTPNFRDYRKMGWVVYYEYEAFSRYCRAVSGHPKYNTR